MEPLGNVGKRWEGLNLLKDSSLGFDFSFLLLAAKIQIPVSRFQQPEISLQLHNSLAELLDNARLAHGLQCLFIRLKAKLFCNYTG